MPRRAVAPVEQSWPADKVERWPIDRLIPYARNARTHSDDQIAQIAASIQEWGFTVPVLADPDGGLIAGHGRVLAARKLGLTSIPVMTAVGWSEAQKRAYVIADNKLTLNASWDDGMLRVEFEALRETDFDLDLTGFAPEELTTLFLDGRDLKVPDDFDSYDETIETEHECPKCGYHFSGGKVVPKAA